MVNLWEPRELKTDNGAVEKEEAPKFQLYSLDEMETEIESMMGGFTHESKQVEAPPRALVPEKTLSSLHEYFEQLYLKEASAPSKNTPIDFTYKGLFNLLARQFARRANIPLHNIFPNTLNYLKIEQTQFGQTDKL